MESQAPKPDQSPSDTPASATPGGWLTMAWLKTQGQPNELPILMYHNVDPNPPNGNTITPAALESDFQTLQANGYTTVTASDAMRILTTDEKPSNKMVWLTFDDSMESFYTQVYPLLKKYGLHATSFVITSNVESVMQGTLSPDQIKEMAASGVADFQSHTVDHIDLSVASDRAQTIQLQKSKEYLDNLLGQQTVVVCYPSGSHNSRTPGIAAGLGYQAGVLDPGRTYGGKTAQNAPAVKTTGMFMLDRFRTWSDMDGTAMMKLLAGAEAYNTKNTAS